MHGKMYARDNLKRQKKEQPRYEAGRKFVTSSRELKG